MIIHTATHAGDTQPTAITPKIRIRERDGVRITTIRDLAPLLADLTDGITDQGDRGHTLEVLAGAVIAIRDRADETDEAGTLGYTTYRDYGRLSTTYHGTRDLPVSAVLDLADRLRTTLADQEADR